MHGFKQMTISHSSNALFTAVAIQKATFKMMSKASELWIEKMHE